MNIVVMASNGGRMPVKFITSGLEIDRHFTYNNVTSISLWWLTDILKINDAIYSIGDIVILSGYVILAFVLMEVIFHAIKSDG